MTRLLCVLIAALLLACILAMRTHRPEIPARWYEPEDGVQPADPLLWAYMTYAQEAHDRESRGRLA